MELWECELEKAFCKRLRIPRDELDSIKNECIFGKNVRMPVREAVIFFFEVEKIMNQKIPEQFLLNGGFETYSKIRDMVATMRIE